MNNKQLSTIAVICFLSMCIITAAYFISDKRKERERIESAAVRKEIASKYAASLPQISGLFQGENSLRGNYNASELKRIANAISDGILSADELDDDLVDMLRANDDLWRMRNAGVYVCEAF